MKSLLKDTFTFFFVDSDNDFHCVKDLNKHKQINQLLNCCFLKNPYLNYLDKFYTGMHSVLVAREGEKQNDANVHSQLVKVMLREIRSSSFL